MLEQGTVGLVADAFPDLLGGGPEADDQGMGLEAGEVAGFGGVAAAGGDDETFVAGEFLADLLFEGAEGGFAVLGEDIGDGAAGVLLDEFIGVDELKVQEVGDEPAHGGLARAHEADEREVDELPAVLHRELISGKPGATHA